MSASERNCGCGAGLEKVLQIQLVVTKVAKWMKSEDLRRLRPTCSLWNVVMAPQIRRTHSPICCAISERGCRLPKAPASLPSHDLPLPFGNFCIHAVDSEYKLPGPSPSLFLVPRFLQFVNSWGGAHLTILNIHFSVEGNFDFESSTAGLRRLFFNLTPALRHLKLFDARCYIASSNNRTLPCDHTVWQELPRLESLQLRGRMFGMLQSLLIYDLVRAATMLKKLNVEDGLLVPLLCNENNSRSSFIPISKLKDLNTDTQVTVSLKGNGWAWRTMVDLSRAGRLRLTRLECCIHYDVDYYSWMSEILALQAPFLKELSIKTNVGHIREVQVPLPDYLPKLEALTVTGPVFRHQPLLQVPFIEVPMILLPATGTGNWPKLSRLSFSMYCPNHTATFWTGSQFQALGAPIRELILPSGRALNSMEILRNLVTGFQHLIKLSIGSNKYGGGIKKRWLPIVWKQWPDLEAIDLVIDQDDGDEEEENDGGCLDSVLTGIGTEKCRELLMHFNANSSKLDGTGGVDYKLAKSVKTAEGIPDLKLLQSFKLTVVAAPIYDNGGHGHGQHDCNFFNPKPKFLTDVSGYYAFAAAAPNSRLQEIVIGARAANQVSETCRAVIRKRLGLGACISFK